jgi:hypothetical protein
MPGIAVTWPPTTSVDRGECSRTSRHISRTLPTLTMMRRCRRRRSGAGDLADEPLARGEVEHVQGAEMFCWMSMMPHERWNIRSENGPCSRVTWLWYSSIGLMARLPNSSSCA